MLSGGTGNYEYKEEVYYSADQTFANATAVGTVSEWVANTKILSITNVMGEFTANTLVIGASSNARYTISRYDPLNVDVNNETYDNLYIEQQANSIIDFSETNPFGDI
jgi:hypothetical protein